jgi:glycosyltransferase involved in cell wall biosynthesis
MTARKPKIAVIGLKGLPAFGGAAAVGENIIEQLKNKYDFTVYSISSHTNLKTGDYNGYRQIVFKKLPFKRINSLYYYLISALHAITRFQKYDFVHLHHRDAAFIIKILRISNYNIITTLHGTKLTEKWEKYHFFFSMQDKYLLNKHNTITSVSPIIYSEIINSSNKEVIYIPNGINQVLDRLRINEINESFIIFAAGRILPSKGCHLMLEAALKLNLTKKLVIAGDIDQILDYKSKLFSLSKGLNVDYIGLIKDKKSLLEMLANAQLFVYPSNNEAMSMMLLDAASVKIPIICADIPENKVIFNEDEVLFFKTDDLDDLADKISYAINNKLEMSRMAESAYIRLIKVYSWSKISSQYDQLYDLQVKNHNIAGIMDFTFKTYRLLLETLIAQGYRFQTFVDYLQHPESRSITLRHDVESKYRNALAFAAIQHELGIKGSYYFRFLPFHFNTQIIKEISSMGHEVGYHYEDFSHCHGDHEAAIRRFEKNLATLRKISEVKTICMEGAPLSRYDNRDLWNKFNYHNYGILGEPYFDVDFNKVLYLTDTGRRWDGEKVSVRDKVNSSKFAVRSSQVSVRRSELEIKPGNLTFHSTSDIITACNSGLLPDQIMFTFHPQRWTDKPLPWIQELVLQNLKNVVKRMIVNR